MPDIYESYNRHQRICIIYSYKCTAACSHCITESSPHRMGKLTLHEAMDCLTIAAGFGRKLAIFSGGEVFLYYQDLLELVAHATSLGLDTLVETNSYWAVNDSVTRRKLIELSENGLKAIHTSADLFHDPYVPLERVLTMARGARSIGLAYDICFLYSGNESRDKEIISLIEAEGFKHSKDHLFPFGTAATLPDMCFTLTDITNYGDCGDLQPTIAPNGDVVACCNINIHRQGSPLFLGNIRESNFAEIATRERESVIARTIEEKGFRFFHQLLIGDSLMSQNYQPRHYASICEYCHELFSDPERVAFFESKLGLTGERCHIR